MASSNKDSREGKDVNISEFGSKSDEGVNSIWDSSRNAYLLHVPKSLNLQVTEVAPGIKLTTMGPQEVVPKPAYKEPEKTEPLDVDHFICEEIQEFDEAKKNAQLVRAKIEKKKLNYKNIGEMQDAIDIMGRCFQELEDIEF